MGRIHIRRGAFKSMRFVIFVCFFLLTTLSIFIYSYFLRGTYEKKIIDQRKNFTINQSNVLINQLVSNGYFSGNSDRAMENQIEQLATVFDGRIMIIDKNYKILTDTYQLKQGNYLVSENVIKAMTGVMTDSENNQVVDDYIACYIPVKKTTNNTGSRVLTSSSSSITSVNDADDYIGLMVVYSSIKSAESTIEKSDAIANQLLVLFIMLVLVIAVVITILLTSYFKNFGKVITEMSEGNGEADVEVKGFTEMKELAETFNEAFQRMNKLEESRQEFVSNVSHELKTPITSVKVLADSLVSQEDVPAEIYREFMEDIVEEVDRENKIINDLLTLVRLDRKSQDVLNVTTVNINDLLELLLKRLRPLAAKRNIEIVYESFRAVSAEADEVKLTLALSNLIENAIKYNIEDGWIRISLNADHKYFYVKIADSGVGIPEDCQDHIFERFYRVDKARSRDTGGTGLGLAITNNAITMHHGKIKLRSTPGEGTTFTVRIPLTYSVSLAVTNSQPDKPEKKSLFFNRKSDKKAGDVSGKTKTVDIPQVSEVKGNLSEVLEAANQSLKQSDENVHSEEEEELIKGTVEAQPVENAEPDVVVLHTDEMENPQLVVINSEEVEGSISEDDEASAQDSMDGSLDNEVSNSESGIDSESNTDSQKGGE